MCLDYEASRDDHQKLQVFWNATLGLPFERVAGEKLDWLILRDRGNNSTYQQGVVPSDGLILTAGVDVQADRLEVVVMAWGRGEQAWVVRYEKIMGDPLQPLVWEQLAHVTGKVYLRVDGVEIKVRATCIDSGYLTQEVYHNVRKYKYLHWFAVKGQSGDRPLVSKPSVQEVNHKGDRIKRGISLYKIGVDLSKEILYSRSQIETPGAKYLNFPSDLDTDWYEGFCSEVQVTKHKNGYPCMVWEKLSGVRNEPLDTAVYALAAAHLAGLTRMNWSNIERELQSQIGSVAYGVGSFPPESRPTDLVQSAFGKESSFPKRDVEKGKKERDLQKNSEQSSEQSSEQDSEQNSQKARLVQSKKRRRRKKIGNFTTNIY